MPLENGELTYYKSNNMIQNYRFSLSNMEIRIINYLISQVKSPKYDEELKEVTLNIKEFCEMLFPDSDDPGSYYNRIPKIIQGLSDKSAWTEIESESHPGKTKKVLIRWIEQPEIDVGYIKIRLNPYLAPELLKLNDGHVKAKLKYSLQASSRYTIPLYELIRSWEWLLKKNDPATVEFDIDTLKVSIDALQKTYSNYAAFQRRVLDVAVDEINELTDMVLSYQTIKKGRKVVKIAFTFSLKNEDNGNIDPNQMTIDAVLINEESKKKKNKENSSEIAKSPEFWERYGDYYDALLTLRDVWSDVDFNPSFIELLLSHCRATLEEEIFTFPYPADRKHYMATYILKQCKFAIYYHQNKKPINNLESFLINSCKEDWGGFKQS